MWCPRPSTPLRHQSRQLQQREPKRHLASLRRDDFGARQSLPGDMELGWVLGIETGPADVAIPATGTSGPASPYPATRTVSGETGMISDLDVTIDGIWHERPEISTCCSSAPRARRSC